MARGKQDYSEGMEVFYAKVMGLSRDSKAKVEFELKQKNAEGVWVVVDNEQNLSGQLVFVGAHTNTDDATGKVYKNINIHLKDAAAKEYYKITLGLNNLSRGLINTLAGATSPIGNLELAAYTSKKGYATMYVVADGDKNKTDWKYKWDELEAKKELTKDKTGKVVDVNTEELDDFIMNTVIPKEVVPLIAFMNADGEGTTGLPESDLSGEETVEKTEPQVVSKSEMTQDELDDLPF